MKKDFLGDAVASVLVRRSDEDLRALDRLFRFMSWAVYVPVPASWIRFFVGRVAFVRSWLRRTLFEHFCGGEDVESSLRKLRTETEAGFQIILDYAVEGSATEECFRRNAHQVDRCIETCALEDSVSFAVVKPSALGCASAMRKSQSQQDLSNEEVQGLRSFLARLDALCQKAQKRGVSLMVDAEEMMFQHYVDDVLRLMMSSYNRQRPVVYTTLQCYRKDAMVRLDRWLAEAAEAGFFLGIKMVRGAYMEKERRRAKKLGLPDPIHETKQACDRAYDEAVAKCLGHIARVSLCVATHNERSCELVASLMKKKRLSPMHSGMCFAQLYGMADVLSYGLKSQGYRVSKYVPYGPIAQVLPYLHRRIRENASVRQGSRREWQLIRQERQRRRREKQGHGLG